jgi:hypothetical protein
VQAFVNVYKRGGVLAFWAGLGPKLVESASKGAILLASKEAIARSLEGAGVNKTLTGFAAGGGGGVCQVAVMGPCTFLVTGTFQAKACTYLRARALARLSQGQRQGKGGAER